MVAAVARFDMSGRLPWNDGVVVLKAEATLFGRTRRDIPLPTCATPAAVTLVLSVPSVRAGARSDTVATVWPKTTVVRDSMGMMTAT